MKPIKLSLATELSLAFFAFSTAALVTLLILERSKFNRSLEHLAYATKTAESLTHESRQMQFKLLYYEASFNQATTNLSRVTTTLNAQLASLEQRIQRIECKHN